MNQEQLLSPEQRIARQRLGVVNGAVDRLAQYDLSAAAEKQSNVFAAYENAIQSAPAPEMQSPIGGVVVESETNSLSEAELAVAKAIEEFGNAN